MFGVGSVYLVKKGWESEELIESWTLVDADMELVANKTGVTRLGFVVLLKFYEIEGRFPRDRDEVPPVAVAYLAQLVGVRPEAFEQYSWASRTVKYHRAQIREAFGTRLATKADEERWAVWLAAEVCPVETRRERLVEELGRRCRRPLAVATGARGQQRSESTPGIA